MKKFNALALSLFFIIGFINSINAQVIYSTDFGTTPNVNPTNWTFTGIDLTISNNTPSTGYPGASGSCYLGEGNSVAFINTSGTSEPSSQIGTSVAELTVNTTGFPNVILGFGMRKSSAGYNTNATYTLEWSPNGSTYFTIPYTEATAGSWGLASGAGLTLPAGAGNIPALYIRWTFVRTGTASNFKIDDVSVSAPAPTAPIVMNAYLLSPTQINVVFSKKIQNPSATTLTNYTLNPSIAISSASLLVNSDTVKLTTASALIVGTTYSLTVNNIKEQTGVTTMTTAQTFTLLNTGTTMKKYTWKTPNLVGTYKGVNIFNGGFSGLQAIKGYSDEIIAITDRGPNADANNNNHAISIGGPSNTAKLFPLPSFAPNFMRVKLQGDSIILLSTTNLKNPAGINVSGLPNFPGYGGTNEIALVDTNGTQGSPNAWGIDCEGIAEGNNNKDRWICEEYGVSIWHTDSTGKAIERFAPYGFKSGKQPEDIGIDTVFNTRNANKGFEGVVFSPNKKVYGFIQNTILLPASDVNLKKNTRLHRFVEIDTRTNTTRMLGYEHDFKPSSGPTSSIGHDKRYIGDAVAVNDHEFLILESGKSSGESYGKVYLIDINPATPINPTNHFVYASNTKSFEQLLDSATAATNGVTVVKKTLLLDLIAAGFDPNTDKKEGLAILNDSTLAVTNDNDFGIVSPSADGLISPTGVKSDIYVFTLPPSKKLNLCPPVSIAALSSTTFCAGDSVKLTSPTIAGITYQWKLNNVPLSGATTSQSYAKLPGAYELFATNASGCIAISNTKTITVNANPTISIVPSSTVICSGQSVSLVSSGANTYSWSTSATSSSIAVSPSVSVSYSVIGTNTNNCSSTNSISITVNTTPTLSIASSTTTICNGQSATLTISGANTYSWSTSATTSSISVTPTTTASYNVIGTDVNNCSATKTISINVAISPTVNATSSSSIVCSGQSATLTASGALTYTWSTSSNATSIIVSPSVTTTYTLNGSFINNCTSSKNITINITPSPTVTETSSHSVVCSGQSATLTASGALTYTWSTSSNATAIVVSPSATTIYTLSGSFINNCVSSKNITVNVTPSPTVNTVSSSSVICAGQTATLTASGALTYTWNTSSNAVSIVVSPSVTTTYTVDGSFINNCKNTSIITQSVSLCTAVNEFSSQGGIRIYPNPASEIVTIVTENIKITNIEITNTLGELIYRSKDIKETNNIINVSGYQKGIYYVSIYSDGERKNTILIVQ